MLDTKAIRERAQAATKPHAAEGGRRCAVEASDSLDDWWVGVSPRNGYGAIVEGDWCDWQALAENVLGVKAADTVALCDEVERLRAENEGLRALCALHGAGAP